MTTIVYRDGILAADTRAYAGDAKPIGKKQKIHQTRYGFVGVSTPAPGFAEELVAWFKADIDKRFDAEPNPNGRTFEAIEITPEGVFFYHDNMTPSGPLDAEFIAIGSGDQYALGALEAGATATQAVEIASRLDAWTNDAIQHVNCAAYFAQQAKEGQSDVAA